MFLLSEQLTFNDDLNEMMEGQPRRPPLANCPDGPVGWRRPTDWICGSLFVIMWLSISIVGIVYTGKSTADIGKPRDYDHNVCKDEYPYLYIASFDIERTTCVKHCPSTVGVQVQCVRNSRFRFCPVSREGLITNHFYRLCYSKNTDLEYHTNKTHSSSFAGEIVEGVEEISQTAAIVTAIGASMLFCTLVLETVATLMYVIVLEVLLALIGVMFLYLYSTGYLPLFETVIQEGKRPFLYLLLGVSFLIAAAISSTMFCVKLNVLRRIQYVLKMAKTFVQDNWGMLFISLFLCGLSLAVLALLIHLLEVTQSNVKLDYMMHGAYNQLVQKKGESITLIVFISLAYLWTHGFIVALSSFIAQAAAIIWYFNQKIAGTYQQKKGVAHILRYIGIHFGTICYQGALVYIPELLGSLVCDSISNVPCFFNYINIYSFIDTILKGSYLTVANQSSWYLLQRVKSSYPSKYLLGRNYVRISKTLIWSASMLICSFLLAQDQPYFFSHSLYLLPPLLVLFGINKVMTLLALEIGTHFSELLGTVGDTLVVVYVADIQTNGFKDVPNEIHLNMQSQENKLPSPI